MKPSIYFCLSLLFSTACNANEPAEPTIEQAEPVLIQLIFGSSKEPEPDNDPCSPYPLCLRDW